MPFTTGMLAQPPLGLHESLVQGFPSLQFTGSLRHCPATQRSFSVHRLASAQSASLVQHAATGRLRHPLGGEQVSTVQPLPSPQSRSAGLVQVPLEHISSPLQTLPSEHENPFG